jgi:photosynthetic reaction center cytochrome c subunit
MTVAKRAGAARAGLVVVVAFSARVALAQGGGAAVAGKTTDEVYKNIQVLKGIPAEQLIPTMQFVAASLGQQCTFCHVEARDKDDKDTKKTARKMMQMVMAINKENFNGRTTVTCYTCHRGSQDPVGTPIISDAERRPPEPQGGAGRGGERPQRPTADQLMDKYLQAVGGMDALAKITSRVEKGNMVGADGRKTPVDIYEKGADERVMITHTANGDRSTGYDGSSAWTMGGNGAPREMASFDREGSQLEDDLYLATHVKQIYSQWRVGRPDKIGDRDVYVLNGTGQGHVPVRLYIDQQTGMLLRLMHFTETPLGRLPAQVDFSDYRDQDGVKVPYKMVMARPAGRTVLELDQVQQNVAVDDSKFTRPAAPPPPHQ